MHVSIFSPDCSTGVNETCAGVNGPSFTYYSFIVIKVRCLFSPNGGKDFASLGVASSDQNSLKSLQVIRG